MNPKSKCEISVKKKKKSHTRKDVEMFYCTEMLTVMDVLKHVRTILTRSSTPFKYGFLPTNSLNSTAKLNCLIYGEWYICNIFNYLSW